MKEIFISHRSTDKEIVDKIIDLFAILGISNEHTFCSSLPGNDVKHKISVEIKEELRESKLNIVILSSKYYESAYCLNEAGVIWFLETPVIIISLDINEKNMIGFLNNEYKIRNIKDKNDVLYIYDEITNMLNIQKNNLQIINRKVEKFIEEIEDIKPGQNKQQIDKNETSNLTDDEIVVIYFFAKRNKRKASIEEINQAFIDSEIFNIDIANALDLLNESGFGNLKENIFEVNLSNFRNLSKFSNNTSFIDIVKKHYIPVKNKFLNMWNDNQFDENDKLFIAYLAENHVICLGDRWVASAQIEQIKLWESINFLNSKLSNNYVSCLNKYINNGLCYPVAYTSYGNPKEYRIYNTLSKYFSNIDANILSELENIKTANKEELPF